MEEKKSFLKKVLLIGVILLLIIVSIAIIIFTKNLTKETPTVSTLDSGISTQDPKITISTIVENLSHPWDLSFLDSTSFAYTQRSGELRGFNTENKKDWLIIKPEDVYAKGEGGLMGLKTDVDFKNNHYLYTCMNVKGPSISIVRWKISNDYKSTVERKDIITGIPSNSSGRHSGCRITMSKDGILWIGTGDTAVGTMAQDPKKLGGKVLRVDRDGRGIEGNMGEPFDSRIFSYGHRNVQGITLFEQPKDEVYGYTLEQGSDRDDEVNLLKKGNFGWDPTPLYNETKPMTDLGKYPEAIPAIWSSGFPTIATSGMTMIKGSQWRSWENAVLLGVLKGQQVRLQKYDSNYKLIRNEKVFSIFGRIRTIVQSPGGNELYLLTDNGDDKIIQVKLDTN